MDGIKSKILSSRWFAKRAESVQSQKVGSFRERQMAKRVEASSKRMETEISTKLQERIH